MVEHPASARAVFLSYAREDAEAARRIADALRAAGVEVWFDQSELGGGDAWDQKIRRQIGACALFIPIISAGTQARAEGYFRLEWKLADRRTDLIGKSKAFLLPVCIDDTRDSDADVPDSFLAVQWTRLKGGEVPPAFCERVKRLLDGGTGSRAAGSRPPVPATEAERVRPAPRARWPWLVGAVAAIVAAYAIVSVFRRPGSEPAKVPIAGVEPKAAAAPVSAVRELVAKAWEQMNKAELARAELELVEGFCRQATGLDPDNAAAWAAWSQVDSWYVYHNFDDSTSRREGARTKAARALQLAPRSYEARLAQACYLVRSTGGRGETTSMFDEEAKGLLTALLQEAPAEPRALLVLGILQRNTGRAAEARATFERLAGNPAFAAQAWNEIAWAAFLRGDYREAETAVDRSLALQACWPNLSLKVSLAEWWTSDLDLAKTMLEKIPVTERQEDHGVTMACFLYYLRREPENLLRVLAAVPRDWLRSNAYDGPKAFLAGLAHHLAGRTDSAQLQWQTALQLTEQRLAARPDAGNLLAWKGQLLARLGRRDEAERTLRLAYDAGAKSGGFGGTHAPIINEILLGHEDAALTLVEATDLTAAVYRNNPDFDPLRANPRFQAALARLEADPRYSPQADQEPEARAQTRDDKSVAVLAFANLSDDKGNEYFSEGISDELLNVLGKVPGLKVSARASSFFFKGQSVTVQEIGRRLQVAHLVDGSVQRVGDQVRISARLSRAETGELAWSETYTRKLTDVFALEDEIARDIAGKLQLALAGFPAAARREVNPEAHRLLLEGRSLRAQRTYPSLDRAEEVIVRALRLDPDFAAAHAELAQVCSVRGIFRLSDGYDEPRSDNERAVAEARRALALDPTLAEAYSCLGFTFVGTRRWAEAEQMFQKAFAVNPNSATAHLQSWALQQARGRLDAALKEADRAVELDPISFTGHALRANNLVALRRFDEALAASDLAESQRPEVTSQGLASRVQALWELGRHDEAVALARQILAKPTMDLRFEADGVAVWILRRAGLHEEAATRAETLFKLWPAQSYLRGAVLVALGRFDDALPFLERTTPLSVSRIYWNELFDPYRNDPRFAQLMAKLGCTEEYRTARETLARLQAGAKK